MTFFTPTYEIVSDDMIADRCKRIYYDGNPTGGIWTIVSDHGI